MLGPWESRDWRLEGAGIDTTDYVAGIRNIMVCADTLLVMICIVAMFVAMALFCSFLSGRVHHGKECIEGMS